MFKEIKIDRLFESDSSQRNDNEQTRESGSMSSSESSAEAASSGSGVDEGAEVALASDTNNAASYPRSQ